MGRHVFQKRSTFYFVSKVPKSLQHHYTKNKIQICLHTDRESVALKQAALLRMQLEHLWSIFRVKTKMTHKEVIIPIVLRYVSLRDHSVYLRKKERTVLHKGESGA